MAKPWAWLWGCKGEEDLSLYSQELVTRPGGRTHVLQSHSHHSKHHHHRETHQMLWKHQEESIKQGTQHHQVLWDSVLKDE